MSRNSVSSLVLDPVRESLVSSAGGVLLSQTIRTAGLGRALSDASAPWRRPLAVHDPGKVLLDVATALALSGDCVADVAAVRAQPEVFGRVASDPTVSRAIASLAADIDVVLSVIRAARADARARAWRRCRPLGGQPGRRDGGQVILDIDATLVSAHSDKAHAEPTHKRGFGFAPMCAFVDHGSSGTGETLTLDLRPGKASPWHRIDHITVLEQALEQLPPHERGQVLVRTDTGGCSKTFLQHITDQGLEYSLGFAAHETVKTAIETISKQARRAALDSDGQPREGAQVAELTGWVPVPVRATRPGAQDWPAGMRVIARRERPTPAPNCG